MNDVSSGLQGENLRLKEVLAAQSLRLQQLQSVASALTIRLKEIEKTLNGCLVISALHGCPYTGPSWGLELEAVEAVMRALSAPETEK